MQPDPSVEARPLYSTASALQGAPECNDFEWLSLTLMPQDSLPKPLIFHLSDLTDFQVQSETLRIPREGACPETLKNNSLVEECENRCTSHAPGLGLLLVDTCCYWVFGRFLLGAQQISEWEVWFSTYCLLLGNARQHRKNQNFPIVTRLEVGNAIGDFSPKNKQWFFASNSQTQGLLQIWLILI